MDVFGLLTLTYPRYVDSMSRDAVENTLHCLITRDCQGHKTSELSHNDVLRNILEWVASESFRMEKGGPAR